MSFSFQPDPAWEFHQPYLKRGKYSCRWRYELSGVESSNVVLQNVNRTISHLNPKFIPHQISTPPEHQLRTQLDGRNRLPLRGLEMFVIGCYIWLGLQWQRRDIGNTRYSVDGRILFCAGLGAPQLKRMRLDVWCFAIVIFYMMIREACKTNFR